LEGLNDILRRVCYEVNSCSCNAWSLPVSYTAARAFQPATGHLRLLL